MVSLFQPTGARIWVRDQSIPELDIAVVKEWRGRSIGTTLLKELISTARTRGCSGLSLSVSAANPAQRLYQRCGFPKWAKPALHGPCSRGCPDGQHALRGAGRLTSVPSNNADRKLDRWAELACRRAGPRRFGSSAPARPASVYRVATRRTCYSLPRLRLRTPP